MFILSISIFRYKINIMDFKVFGEVIPTGREDLKPFDDLNKLIEREELGPDTVRSAYHDLLLDTLDNSQKTNLHWHIQYLFEEVKIPVNRVLTFLDAKFWWIKDAMIAEVTGTKLENCWILRSIDIFSNLSIWWEFRATVFDQSKTTEKSVHNYLMVRWETWEQRFERFRTFVSELDKNSWPRDVIKVIANLEFVQ